MLSTRSRAKRTTRTSTSTPTSSPACSPISCFRTPRRLRSFIRKSSPIFSWSSASLKVRNQQQIWTQQPNSKGGINDIPSHDRKVDHGGISSGKARIQPCTTVVTSNTRLYSVLGSYKRPSSVRRRPPMPICHRQRRRDRLGQLPHPRLPGRAGSLPRARSAHVKGLHGHLCRQSAGGLYQRDSRRHGSARRYANQHIPVVKVGLLVKKHTLYETSIAKTHCMDCRLLSGPG